MSLRNLTTAAIGLTAAFALPSIASAQYMAGGPSVSKPCTTASPCAASVVVVGSQDAVNAVNRQMVNLGIDTSQTSFDVQPSYWNHNGASGTKVYVQGIQGGESVYYLTPGCISRLNNGQRCIDPNRNAPPQPAGTACFGQNGSAIVATRYTYQAPARQPQMGYQVVAAPAHNTYNTYNNVPSDRQALLGATFQRPGTDVLERTARQNSINNTKIIGDLLDIPERALPAVIAGEYYVKGQKARRPNVNRTVVNAGDVVVDNFVDTNVEVTTGDVTMPGDGRDESDGGTSGNDTDTGHMPGDGRDESDGGTSGSDTDDNEDEQSDANEDSRDESDGQNSGNSD